MTDQEASSIDEQLSRAISTLTPFQKEKLLAYAETLHTERRRSQRKKHFAEISYADDKRSGSGFIKNISTWGLYIEPEGNLEIGQKITLSFPHPSREGQVKVTGKIVRKDRKGFAVQFVERIDTL